MAIPFKVLIGVTIPESIGKGPMSCLTPALDEVTLLLPMMHLDEDTLQLWLRMQLQIQMDILYRELIIMV